MGSAVLRMPKPTLWKFAPGVRAAAMELFMQMATLTTSILYATPPLQNQTWSFVMIAPQRSAVGITRTRILSAMTHVATAMVCCPLP